MFKCHFLSLFIVNQIYALDFEYCYYFIIIQQDDYFMFMIPIYFIIIFESTIH